MENPSNASLNEGRDKPPASLEQSHLCPPCTEALRSAQRVIEETDAGQNDDAEQSDDAQSYHAQRESITYVCSPSIDKDCYLCWRITQLSRSLLPSFDATVPMKVVITCDDDMFEEDPTLFAEIATVKSEIWDWREIRLCFKSSEDIHEKLASTTTTTLRGNTWSQETAALARNWLQTCLDEHTDCGGRGSRGDNTDRSRLPTRILQVQRTETGAINARLRLTADLPLDFRYLTLSHCWGLRPFLTLTQAGYDSFLEEVPVSDPNFNRCFNDAMGVTVDLGYEYVWIDSLCIIQDSPGWADWVRECPRVGHIYANGNCNLSATGFATGLGGMVAERNAAVQAPCPITMPGAGLLYMFEDGNPEDSLYPIVSRGWVVQEHALSPRTLHFLKDQICWVCRAGAASEIDFGITAADVPVLQKNQREKNLFASATQQPRLGGDGGDDDDDANNEQQQQKKAKQDAQHRTLMEWYDVVRRVSGTRLTRYSDRLPALSGLAAYVHPSLQSPRYVAGHWEPGLVESLYWQPNLYAEAAAAAAAAAATQDDDVGFIAPSWSWASSLRPVDFRFISLGDAVVFPRVVGIDVTLSAEADPFGAVSEGALHLCGPRLKPVQMSFPNGGAEYLVALPGDVSMRLTVHPDKPTLTSLGSVVQEQTPAGPDATDGPPSGYAPLPCSWPDSLHLLPLYAQLPFGICGLLVEKVGSGNSSGGGGDVVRRVGIFQESRFMHHHKALAATGNPNSNPHRSFDDVVDAIFSLPGWELTMI